jgi:hypothetical protein
VKSMADEPIVPGEDEQKNPEEKKEEGETEE